MSDKEKLILFIDKLLEKNCSFALWSVPGDSTLELLISCQEALIYPRQFNRLNGQEGFVFAPYHISETTPLILLKPDIYKTGIQQILRLDIETIPRCQKKNEGCQSHFIIDKEDYLNDISETVHTIKNTKLSKAIVSRIIPVKRNEESLGKLYVQLLNQTPNAFVYLVNLPKAGIWMGATPEILLKSEGKTLETVSLAGTQARHNKKEYAWNTKDIEEQAFVSRYLLDVFYQFNIHPYTTRGPETLESGKVAHLVTSFQFAKKKLEDSLGDFIAELHPTPAVCGYPKQKADKFIRQIEKHDRRYYSGFLGPWQLKDSVRLFVNLRCMEILPQQYMLYSGGGITSRSVPEQEWEETNNKAKTLLSAIEAIQ
ncbi:isochorismate synthase [uncultured Draconibacterium sp.]|uniref:isochorismate synthase n=1 Tax=uncultured Draconibacterium sp. TaxID=1573823 RepID=UPI0025D7A4CD|nr:isochorismate synthase [uncultured Draconibacterium sp.]